MQRIGKWVVAGALAAAMTGATGCALFVVGAGAGAGAVAYHENELRVSREVALERAWDAANSAMREMEYTITPAETRKDATGGLVQGRNAKDQPVRIELTRKSDLATEIRIRVGTIATSDNRAAEQLLYEKMIKHF